MGATVQAQIANGSGPTNGSAEGGITFGRDDLVVSTAAIPVPTGAPSGTGTHFSELKYLFLDVTGTSTTAITNRKISWASGPATGISGWFKDQATYTQNTGTQGTSAGQYPADSGSNGATPASGYTSVTTSPQGWDATSHTTGSTGKNGDYCQTIIGVDGTYASGAGTATLPNLTATYDEA